MFKYYNEFGLESNTLESIEIDELELDIFGCESAADLTASLLDYSLEDEITSLGFNSVLIAETVAGIEGVDFTEILSELGIEGIKETAKAGWYKVKAVMQAVANTILTFFKKMCNIFATTDKLFDKIHKKAMEIKTKWKSHKFAEGIERSFETSTKYIVTEIESSSISMRVAEVSTLTQNLIDMSKKSTHEFIEYLNKISTKDLDMLKDFMKKDKSNAIDDNISAKNYIKKTEMKTYEKLKSECEELTTTIINTSETLIRTKIFDKVKSSIEGIEKLKKEIANIKGEDIEKILGGEEKRQKIIQSASIIVTQYNKLPSVYALKAKSYATACSAGFTEIAKFMKISK